MRAEVVEVFTLEVDLRAAELGAEVAAMEHRRGAAAVVREKLSQFGVELRVILILKEGLRQFIKHFFKALVHKLAAVGAKVTGLQCLFASLAGFGHTHGKLLLRRTTFVKS